MPTLTISPAPSLPAGRALHAAALLNSLPLIAGGNSWNPDRTIKHFHNDTLLFQNNSWHPGPTLPQPFAEGAFASDNTNLYLIGGTTAVNTPTNAVFRLTISPNSQPEIQPLPSLPHPLSAAAATLLNQTLYLAAGNKNPNFTNELWSLNLAARNAAWQQLPPIPGPPRAYPAFTTTNNLLYLLGGLESPGHPLADLLSFNPLTNQWQNLGNLPAPGYCWSAAPINNSTLLIAGRADGQIHPEISLLTLNPLSSKIAAQALIQTTCAPLLQINPTTYWLIAGEPDSKRTRTNLITAITL